MKNYILDSTPGYKSLSPEDKAVICNGAGAAGKWISNFIPNTMYGLDVVECFNVHDYDYHVGVTRRDKIIADRRLLSNLLMVINNESNFIMGFLRRRRALKYYEAVYLYGDEAFFK